MHNVVLLSLHSVAAANGGHYYFYTGSVFQLAEVKGVKSTHSVVGLMLTLTDNMAIEWNTVAPPHQTNKQ